MSGCDCHVWIDGFAAFADVVKVEAEEAVVECVEPGTASYARTKTAVVLWSFSLNHQCISCETCSSVVHPLSRFNLCLC